jgi:hypothetical protein
MSGNSGPYLFSYNSKNTLNRIIFDSNRRRREGFENANASPAPAKSNLTPTKPSGSSLLGRRTPLQTRSFQSLCHDIDEVQQEREDQLFLLKSISVWTYLTVTSSSMAYQAAPDDAYMRQNESILLSPGGRPSFQAGIHVSDQSLASPPTVSVSVFLLF